MSLKASDVHSEQSEDDMVCVDDVPSGHALLNVKKLEDEGQQAFNTVLQYQSSAHISRLKAVLSHNLYSVSINLRLICIQAPPKLQYQTIHRRMHS